LCVLPTRAVLLRKDLDHESSQILSTRYYARMRPMA
jgi:hypothetical protein